MEMARISVPSNWKQRLSFDPRQYLKTRERVGTGDNVLIGGFIITGTDLKKVLLRAIGPSLPLSGFLADPTIELHDANGGVIALNDNWQTNLNKQEIIDTGIAPPNDLESALLVTLTPSAYTAIVKGANDGAGIALVEASHFWIRRSIPSWLISRRVAWCRPAMM